MTTEDTTQQATRLSAREQYDDARRAYEEKARVEQLNLRTAANIVDAMLREQWCKTYRDCPQHPNPPEQLGPFCLCPYEQYSPDTYLAKVLGIDPTYTHTLAERLALRFPATTPAFWRALHIANQFVTVKGMYAAALNSAAAYDQTA